MNRVTINLVGHGLTDTTIAAKETTDMGTKCDCGNLLTEPEIKNGGREGPCEDCIDLVRASGEGMAPVESMESDRRVVGEEPCSS